MVGSVDPADIDLDGVLLSEVELDIDRVAEEGGLVVDRGDVVVVVQPHGDDAVVREGLEGLGEGEEGTHHLLGGLLDLLLGGDLEDAGLVLANREQRATIRVPLRVGDVELVDLFQDLCRRSGVGPKAERQEREKKGGVHQGSWPGGRRRRRPS